MTDAAARLRRSEAEIDRLKAIISDMKQALRSGEPDLPAEWGLHRSEALAFAALIAREVVTRDGLLLATAETRRWDGVSPGAVEVLICRLRRKLKPFGIRIISRRYLGYSLEPQERARWRRKEGEL